jgi:hypothetical protein
MPEAPDHHPLDEGDFRQPVVDDEVVWQLGQLHGLIEGISKELEARHACACWHRCGA